MMLVKVHRRGNQRLLAICDKQLCGKRFAEKDLQLDLTSDFYKGEEKTAQEIKKLIKDAYLINLVGDEAVGFALKNKLIEKKNVIMVGNIPHAQTLFLRED